MVVGAVAGVAKVIKVARLARNVRRGLQAEATILAELEKAGFRVVGRQVYVRTPFRLRRLDYVVQYGDEFRGIEVKADDAVRRTEQMTKDTWINRHGVPTAGESSKNIPEVDGTNTIWDCDSPCQGGTCHGP